jgi:hypothetical protein
LFEVLKGIEKYFWLRVPLSWNPAPPDYARFALVRLGFEEEDPAKQGKVRLDSQKGFTNMDEIGDMHYGIWV